MDHLHAPDERSHLGILNPLSIAVVVVLATAGGALGWRMRTDAPTARPTPEAAASALALERVDAKPMCRSEGHASVRTTVLEGPSSAEAAKLAEHLPKRSPLPGFEKVAANAIDPARETEYELGAVEGHVASFRPAGDGGFDVYAFRYVTRKAAADAVASNVLRRVCDFGASPLLARGRPGMIVLEEDGGQWSSAWWVTHADVLVVKVGGSEDEAAELANLAAIAGATALF